MCDLLLHCTKPEEKKKEDEPVLQSPPETINIVADLPVKKSKKNSALYQNKPEVEVARQREDVKVKKSKKNSAIYQNKPAEVTHEEKVKSALEVKVGASVECAICRLVMEYIDDVIAENATQVRFTCSFNFECSVQLPTI